MQKDFAFIQLLFLKKSSLFKCMKPDCSKIVWKPSAILCTMITNISATRLRISIHKLIDEVWTFLELFWPYSNLYYLHQNACDHDSLQIRFHIMKTKKIGTFSVSKMISWVYKLPQKVLQNKSSGLFHVKF